MESINKSSTISNSLTQEKHKIFIKDKHGVYFLQPFVDQNKKLLNLENASVVIKSKNLIGVGKILNFEYLCIIIFLLGYFRRICLFI